MFKPIRGLEFPEFQHCQAHHYCRFGHPKEAILKLKKAPASGLELKFKRSTSNSGGILYPEGHGSFEPDYHKVYSPPKSVQLSSVALLAKINSL